MRNDENCIFCNIPKDRIVWEDEAVVIINDNYPVSKGHMLIIPKRHVSSFFDTSDKEKFSLILAISVAKEIISKTLSPDGYNIGINEGVAAGQTIMHLHIHIIPRYLGDVPDPRGGIRWLFPEKAEYWNK
ncbi:HIT family protein [Thermodesulfovibrio sp.]|uniref:HIT family protein n=1 Tax=Thermodesulfovibrio sp. TaxID=2067987 RepID=UPI00309BD54F